MLHSFENRPAQMNSLRALSMLESVPRGAENFSSDRVSMDIVSPIRCSCLHIETKHPMAARLIRDYHAQLRDAVRGVCQSRHREISDAIHGHMIRHLREMGFRIDGMGSSFDNFMPAPLSRGTFDAPKYMKTDINWPFRQYAGTTYGVTKLESFAPQPAVSRASVLLSVARNAKLVPAQQNMLLADILAAKRSPYIAKKLGDIVALAGKRTLTIDEVAEFRTLIGIGAEPFVVPVNRWLTGV